MLKTVSAINGFVSPTFSGNVTLSNGNLVIGTSGKGIDFSATPGTGTSELLADYEEGTWTPILQFGGASTGIAYVLNNGFYTKTGNIVSGTCWILLSSKGSATGDATLTGLPFTNAGSDGNQSPCPTDSSAITFADQMIATVEKSNTFIKLREVTNGGSNSALTDADFGNSSSLQISFQYRAA
jgi:hypothetical protein